MAEGRELDDWTDAYMEYTDNTEPRPLFRRWVSLSTIAACLQRKTWLPLGTIRVYPNMYIVLVGPPAARKGTAMLPARVFLDKLGVEIAADESSRQKLVTRLKAAAQTDSSSSMRIYTHSSLTIFATELTVFLGYNNAELMTILCKWYDCESKFRYDTHIHGEEIVTNVWINLLGATTPTLLQSSMPQDATGSGLISRIVFVYEDDKGKVVIFPALTEAQEVLEPKILRDLERINMLSGSFSFSSGFLDDYSLWRTEQEAHPPFRGHLLQAYTERRAVHALKMSMLFSASRTNDMEVTSEDFERAVSLLKETENKMPKAFIGVGANPLAEVQTRIMEVIATRRRIPSSTLMHMFLNDVTKFQMDQIIQALSLARWCNVDLATRDIVFIGGEHEAP